MLSTHNFKFIDVSNYLAPGYSYSQFLKAYGCDIQKGYFPYEWFASYDKLEYHTLPPKEAFYSKLTNLNPLETQQDHDKIIALWKENGMKTFCDYLMYYNNI